MASRARLLAVGAAAAGAVLVRRSRSNDERIDLYFDDGSKRSLRGGSRAAAPLLALARAALRA